MRRSPALIRTPLGLAAAAALSGAGLFAQAWYAARKPLPSFEGGDISGTDSGTDSGADRPSVVVAALGDSSLTGPGLDDPEQVWLRRATRSVAEELDCRIEVRSVAVGGSRVAEGRSQQLPALDGARADVAVVALGANDVIHLTPLRAFRRELRALVRALQATSGAVIVGGVPDVGTIPRLPEPLGRVSTWRSRSYDRITREVATDEGARFVDVSPANARLRDEGTALFCDDQFHCNAAGHLAWAELAVPILRDAVRDELDRRAVATTGASTEPAST